MSILIPLDVLLPEPIAPVDSSKWIVARYVTPPDVLSTAEDTPAVAAAAIAPASAATPAVTVDAPLQAARMYKPQSHASRIRNLVDRLVKRIQTIHRQAPTTPFEFANIATNLPDLLSNPPDLLPMAEDTPAVIDPVIALAASTAALTISENAAAATPAVTIVAPLQAARNSSQQPRVSRERHRMAKLAKLIRINHLGEPVAPFVSFNSANHRQDLLLNPSQH
ncbi:hypothetical protein BC831DRAFT_447348 [Entophlyctis helioformis]|nr:hypothetical protein BC831DRAFT_447348 [Entophlyctis helioformis]